jgi:hypothetical protein
MSGNPVSIFISYSRKDEALMRQLEKHLAPLRRSILISSWHDGCIISGEEWEPQIKKNLEEAQIILLLISVDFINSDYCYNVELTRAIERHKFGKVRVIPIILRDCDWQMLPVGNMLLGKLQALPQSALPIDQWASRDQAFANIARSIRQIIEQLQQQLEQTQQRQAAAAQQRQQEELDRQLRAKIEAEQKQQAELAARRQQQEQEAAEKSRQVFLSS